MSKRAGFGVLHRPPNLSPGVLKRRRFAPSLARSFDLASSTGEIALGKIEAEIDHGVRTHGNALRKF